MASDDIVLEGLAQDGKMDYTQWPGLLERILPRLEHIVYNNFPTPSIPIPSFATEKIKEEQISMKKGLPVKEEPLAEQPTSQEEPATTSQEPAPDDKPTSDREPSINDEATNMKREQSLSSSGANPTVAPPGGLPPPLLSLFQTIQSTLRTTFPTAPPHTAQRLAELVLRPTNHYRTLPSYLRALDRIVSVASPASVFPLPNLAQTSANNGRHLNGTSSPSPDAADQDFIGGAELTEIPWLRNTSSPAPHHNGPAGDLRTESTALIDGPNGAGSIETVSVNMNGVASTASRDESIAPIHGITQGELVRQEQEAGIVTVPAPAPNGRVTRSSAAATAAANRAVGMPEETVGATESAVDTDERVHARGPGVIGMEDMGPQAPGSGLEGGIDVEGALGRRGEGEGILYSEARSGEGADAEIEDKMEEDEGKDSDGDFVIVDADGGAEREQQGAATGRENKEPDAVDSMTLS